MSPFAVPGLAGKGGCHTGAMDDERRELASRVTTARLTAGMGKEGAARFAGVSSITWKRVEDGLPVRADRLALILEAVKAMTTPAAPRDITEFDDDELLAELRRRMTRK